ncbi:CheY-like superfamily [Corchorus olitorius]|uniref:CheY-like superfamily n=1 Tax=Corchorus olitorius TaxID=93759 RepID=A0A1R3KW68_9ROSI|nr:CheY-like superfamily [Corchorus olitorius]
MYNLLMKYLNLKVENCARNSASSSMSMVDRLAEDMGLMNNFTVLVVENGRNAVDLCLAGGTFKLILMDKEMPVMDGVEHFSIEGSRKAPIILASDTPQRYRKATRELRAIGVNSLIVGVTSRGSPDEKKAFMEAGLDFCFEKPLTPEKITILLHELNWNN